VGGQSATASLTVANGADQHHRCTFDGHGLQGTAVQLTATGEYTERQQRRCNQHRYMEFVQYLHRHHLRAGLVSEHWPWYRHSLAHVQNVYGHQFSDGCSSIRLADTGADYIWHRVGLAQLDATSGVSGTFTYSPPAGTLLPAGSSIAKRRFYAGYFSDCFHSRPRRKFEGRRSSHRGIRHPLRLGQLVGSGRDGYVGSEPGHAIYCFYGPNFSRLLPCFADHIDRDGRGVG